MNNTADYIGQARAAVNAVATAQDAASAASLKLLELERLERAEQAEREELRALADEEEALRQLDGVDAAPVDTNRPKRLAALDKSVPARAAAIRMQQGRVAMAEAELRQARNA